MKNRIILWLMNSKAKLAVLFLMIFIGFSGFMVNSTTKYYICHITGNSDKIQLIVPYDAAIAHFNHGDKIFCNQDSELNDMFHLVEYDPQINIKP